MTEIETARKAIKEYRKAYGQHQLPDDCWIQLMMGHEKDKSELPKDIVKVLVKTKLLCSINGCKEKGATYFGNTILCENHAR